MRGQGRGTDTTIIKRSAKKHHSGAHTGAWKVAFADFTLAMMALFMVLWIVGAVSEEERHEIMSHIHGNSIFSEQSFLSIPLQHKNGADQHFDIVNSKSRDNKKESNWREQFKQTDQSLQELVDKSAIEMKDLSRMIMKISNANNAQSNLNIEIIPQGLRILVQDDKNREMFSRSSALLTPFFTRLLGELAPVLNNLNNKIIITGHTDVSRYRDQELYNNWNLSGERAMAARRALEKGGLDGTHLLQINAMADQMLLDEENPLGAANRRIEIMVLTKAATATLYQFFGDHGIKTIKTVTEKAETIKTGAEQAEELEESEEAA
ncbi:putative lateral flagellar export/assembly protein LafU [Candidatus Fukatsuia symbiotica]|uniref:Putative lateral flagellar export/assembly protein LafU n=1 Tax=Candidatus Fukatsuia symbiotica TaxID=1878942 RepID=A0A2U8I6E7_9GAMM|nr:putative lateral flagellar export/assembly protein LafU [Candidatus Fukatsuia symbiotica]AWK14639.1 putative lateral flagellar export/assembly protein LafU [Candidatus Fukatsuia symbiotica]MEA9444952.1 putative lateral flagellar export/assembly protein LafU [Candidatus Fukatsuia symbiotica]